MSNINPQNIDGTFPIAGQDNNSQGFRDNFTNTINNFTFAAAELTDLQTYAVRTAPLGSVGQTGTPLNDMNYTYLTSPQLKKAVETMSNIGINTNGSVSVDWSAGHYQKVYISGDTGVTFATTWPAANYYTKLRLQVNTNSNIANVSFSGVTVNNITSIQGYSTGQSVVLPANNQYLFEFATEDNGTTLTIQDVLRNYNVESNGASASFTTITATTATATTVNATNVNATGNVLASGAVVTALTINGNITRAGGQIDSGYQYHAPSGNGAPTGNLTATIGTNVSRLILDPAASISLYANITLPGGNVDAKVVTISSTQTVQFLGVVPSTGTTLVNQGNIALSAGTSATYFYHATETKWYKIG